MKLRAGSLFYALAISVIIALVSSSLLLAAHFNRVKLQQDAAAEEVIRNARSGIELLLGETSVAYDAPVTIDLFGRGMDSVRLERKTWGAFEIAVADAYRHHASHRLVAAVGRQPDVNDRTALVLADLDRALAITGKTALRGDCYLPKAGVKRAYIEGESYNGDQLVYGQLKTSERFLPAYNDSLVKRLARLFDFIPDSMMNVTDFNSCDSLRNSFTGKTLYVWSDETLTINAQHVEGQVCFISRRMIRVGKNAHVTNALLIAPKIVIDDDVQGQFQAFARDSLVIGEHVRLHYPSVMGLITGNRSPDAASLFIGKETIVMGQLFACNTVPDFRKRALIRISKDAVICGSVYSSDLVDLQGSVYGDVTCSKFELKTNSAVYENHLLNAVIDRGKRSPEFIASALAQKKGDRKGVVQWLR